MCVISTPWGTITYHLLVRLLDVILAGVARDAKELVVVSTHSGVAGSPERVSERGE